MAARSPSTKKFSRERVRLIDLDQRPELMSVTLAAFAACPPGKHHLVCGLPASMGIAPTTTDLISCLGVVLAVPLPAAAGATNTHEGSTKAP